MAKTINFHIYRTPQDQRGGLTNPFCSSPWSCCHKSVLRNHHMQYPMVKRKCNWL